MSAIASFYLIADEKRDEIVRAAESQSNALKKKRFGFLPAKLPLNPDPFWEFIRLSTEELEQYPYSGYLLLEIELLAPDSLDSIDAVGTRLSEITQSTFISFRPDDAAKTIKVLDETDFSDEAIRKFLVEDEREDEYPEIAQPLQDSVTRVKHWLKAVPKGKTGILSIG